MGVGKKENYNVYEGGERERDNGWFYLSDRALPTEKKVRVMATFHLLPPMYVMVRYWM